MSRRVARRDVSRGMRGTDGCVLQQGGARIDARRERSY